MCILLFIPQPSNYFCNDIIFVYFHVANIQIISLSFTFGNFLNRTKDSKKHMLLISANVVTGESGFILYCIMVHTSTSIACDIMIRFLLKCFPLATWCLNFREFIFFLLKLNENKNWLQQLKNREKNKQAQVVHYLNVFVTFSYVGLEMASKYIRLFE